MFKKEIVEVKGYIPVVYNGKHVSPCSFRLDLREVMKKYMPDVYFRKLETVKNFGCYLFGIPDEWKGLIGIECRDTGDNKADIVVYKEDFRDIEKLDKEIDKAIIKAIELLKEKYGCLEDYIVKGDKNENDISD